MTKEIKKKKKRKTKLRPKKFLCFLDRKIRPMPDDILDGIAARLVEWARDDEDALKISQFYLEEGMSAEDFYKFIKRHEGLRKANQLALQYIGNRREMGAIKGDYPANTIMPYMAMYDKEHKRNYEWKAQLRKQIEDSKNDGPKIVVIDRIPSSEMVPKKIEEDDE